MKIITGDRDLLQLVNERVIVNLPGKSLADARDFFPEDVQEYLGVLPSQVVDFKALVGDKSDNIPGVAGIGEKTAISLLQSYSSLDGIYAHITDISGSVRTKLESGREQAYLSYKLAQIVTDLQISVDLQQARPQSFDPAKLEALFRELEFRTLMVRLTNLEQSYGIGAAPKAQQLNLFAAERPVIQQAPPPAGEIKYQVIDTSAALTSLVERLERATSISFDTETTSTDQMRADLVGISLAVDGDQGYYIPVGHSPGQGEQLPLSQVLDALQKPLTDERIPKIGHNLKYDFVMLARYGLRVRPLAFDTMIAEWLINPTSRNLGLKNLAWVRLDYKMTEIETLIGKGSKQITMADVPIAQAAAYASADAAIAFRLLPQLQAELDKKQASRLFAEIEMPLIPILADMEIAGIALDIDFLASMSADLGAQLAALEQGIYEAAGTKFNINSPQQLSEILFDRLKLPPPDRTARTSTGFYSTAAGVLESAQRCASGSRPGAGVP